MADDDRTVRRFFYLYIKEVCAYAFTDDRSKKKKADRFFVFYLLCFGYLLVSRVQIMPQKGNRLFTYTILFLKKSPPKTAKTPIKSGFSGTKSILSSLDGGDGGIRTLEPFLAVTRFPVVRPRPTRRHLQTLF